MSAPTWPPDPPLIAVIRVPDASAVSDEHLLALARSGLAIEVTMTCRGAITLLRRAAGLVGARALVGVGTVLSAAEASEAEVAGAQFESSPALWPGLETRSVTVIPGVFTPRDVMDARGMGFTTLKLFPARLGPELMSDLRSVFPDVHLLPSGGVSAENVGNWRRSGAAGAFLGRSLMETDGELADPETLEQRAERIVASWTAADGERIGG
jgi:2-dehydro-3-deoxyphosphogluconate aldolase/(4S)-4-hydroxy-2-oxoglutarate aldolase